MAGEGASGEKLESRVSELERDMVTGDVAPPGARRRARPTRRIAAARAEIQGLRALRAGAGASLVR